MNKFIKTSEKMSAYNGITMIQIITLLVGFSEKDTNYLYNKLRIKHIIKC